MRTRRNNTDFLEFLWDFFLAVVPVYQKWNKSKSIKKVIHWLLGNALFSFSGKISDYVSIDYLLIKYGRSDLVKSLKSGSDAVRECKDHVYPRTKVAEKLLKDIIENNISQSEFISEILEKTLVVKVSTAENQIIRGEWEQPKYKNDTKFNWKKIYKNAGIELINLRPYFGSKQINLRKKKLDEILKTEKII